MENDVFDGLTRALAAPGSRRGVLRGFAGSLLAVASLGQTKALAQVTKVEVCHYNAATGTYSPLMVPINAVAAHEAHGDVVDVDSDPRSCGACGHACSTGQVCANGTCVSSSWMIHGEIDASDPALTGSSCANGAVEGAHYEAHTFYHLGGLMSLTVHGEVHEGLWRLDPSLFLFAGDTLPVGDMCIQAIAYSWDLVCTLDSYMETSQPAGWYTAVVAGYAGMLGTYTLEKDGFEPPCT
jgi:hypothetical protein